MKAPVVLLPDVSGDRCSNLTSGVILLEFTCSPSDHVDFLQVLSCFLPWVGKSIGLRKSPRV